MTESRVPSEVEAKLLLPEGGDLRPLARLQHLGRYRIQARNVARLHSVYLDTSALTLAHHGIALRVRRQSGHWEATVKWRGSVRGDVHDRPELTVPLPRAPRTPFALPSGPLAIRLAALVAARPLTPILISDVRRRRLDLLPATGGAQAEPIAELALDRVCLRGPRPAAAAVTYSEVEIEQRRGTRRDVAGVARLLRQRFGLLPSPESKFARGLALVYRDTRFGALTPAVQPQDTLEEAARRIIGLHLRRLRGHDPGTRLGEDAEALHDMRVACRRLRAAVHALEEGIPQRLQRYLRDELEWLGQALGGVRDLDVQLDLLARYDTAPRPDPGGGIAGLRTYMETDRARRRIEMLNALDSDRYYRLLVRLEDFARGRTRSRQRNGETQSVAAIGRKALKRAFRRLLKRGRAIDAAPTDEDFHALRIRAKRLRYLLEFLRELVGKPGRRLIKDLVRLQDLLGSHHDGVVAAEFIRRYVEGPGAQASAEAFLALGAFMGEQRRLAEVARGDFQRAWARFSRPRTLKGLDGVLQHLQLTAAAVPPSPPGATGNV